MVPLPEDTSLFTAQFFCYRYLKHSFNLNTIIPDLDLIFFNCMFSGCEKAITHYEVDYLKESLSAMHVAQ